MLASWSSRGRYVLSKNPTEQCWFEYFVRGMAAKKGDVVEQNWAYTIKVLHKLIQMYEAEWETCDGKLPLGKICSCMFLIASCTGGFRGYETVWTNLGAPWYNLDFFSNRTAVSWPVVDRFNSDKGQVGCHMIPIAGTTRSGIEVFKWSRHYAGRLADLGRTTGWAFRRHEKTRTRASEYMGDIYEKLERIQNDTNLIAPTCEVRKEYGAMHSARQFFDTECLNKGAPP
jgi:hypothetical protein